MVYNSYEHRCCETEEILVSKTPLVPPCTSLNTKTRFVGSKSCFSQRVTQCEGAVAIALKLLCVLDDNPVQGWTEVTVPGKWDLPKTIHFANKIEQSRAAWSANFHGAGDGTGSSRTSAEGPSGYFCFLWFRITFLLDYAASSHRLPSWEWELWRRKHIVGQV